jgi:Transposase IS116/IS110/IS902 family
VAPPLVHRGRPGKTTKACFKRRSWATACRSAGLARAVGHLGERARPAHRGGGPAAPRRATLDDPPRGGGGLTALGTVLVLGPLERFPDPRHVTSYVGVIPQEESYGRRQRFGHLTKQGNRLLRFLLTEAR